MTPTDQFLLSALLPTEANKLRLRALVSSSDLDWAVIVARSKARGTAALLRYNLSRAAVLDAVPQAERDFLATESQAWAAKQQVYALEAMQLMQALQARGIASLPLKGAALMLGNYYPLPGLRSAVDIDLLVAPSEADAAFAIAEELGFVPYHVPKPVRVPLPLPHELRHLPIMRGPHGVLMEMHYRAFHDLRHRRDFTLADMQPRAAWRNGVLLPATEDIALHLIQHSLVDLGSAYTAWRTLADLHFLCLAEPAAREKLLARAEEFQLRSAASLALETLQMLEDARADQAGSSVRLLLEAAIGDATAGTMEAARLFEYLDLRQQPVAKLKHLYALLTAAESDTSNVVAQPPPNKFKRALGMLRRFHWHGVTLADVRRVLALRNITLRK
ncbi:MAG TPA: nucleotidyltransferase family protein [Blastocatellia bacterium]|nr:nucleotidyltransferase family protein [Blastocatellia bacterium]